MAGEMKPGTSPSTRLRALVIGLAVAIVVFVGVIALGGGGNGGSAAPGPNGRITGVTDPAHFDLPAFDGRQRVQLASFRGKPVVVNMFASWCTECRTELPGFAKVAEQLRGQVAFVGVNSQETSTSDGIAMADEFHLAASGFVLARDVGGDHGSGMHDALGATGMPVTAFYDAEGRLVDRSFGAVPEDRLRARLSELYHLRT